MSKVLKERRTGRFVMVDHGPSDVGGRIQSHMLFGSGRKARKYMRKNRLSEDDYEILDATAAQAVFKAESLPTGDVFDGDRWI